MSYIGVVGHRILGPPSAYAYVASSCHSILRNALATNTNTTALSALARGADTLFAEAALELRISLDVVRPFDDYAHDFSSPRANQRYQRLRSAARHETRLSFRKRSPQAYKAAMEWVVTNSDLLVVIWDNSPPQGIGGTGHAIELARSQGRPWIHVDVVNKRLLAHISNREHVVQAERSIQ